jgi:hypothetical protein
MAVGYVDNDGFTFDARELRACDPVFETLGAQLQLKLALDEIPWALILTDHRNNTTPFDIDNANCRF